jgi:Tfp pilus assembly PilM family ATPase
MPAHEASRKYNMIALQFDEVDVVVIVLAGEHALSGTQNLRNCLAFAAGMRVVVVDLSENTLVRPSPSSCLHGTRSPSDARTSGW